MSYEQALAAFCNEVNGKLPPNAGKNIIEHRIIDFYHEGRLNIWYANKLLMRVS